MGKVKKVLGVLAVLLVFLPAVIQAKGITLKLAHVTSTVEPIHLAFMDFAKRVHEKSNGQVTVEVYAGGALGTNKEVYEQARMGAPVIANVDPGYLSDYVPDIGILNGPYLVTKPSEFKKLSDSDWYAEQVKIVSENGFQIIALNGFFGARHIISDKPIRTLDDIKGLQIRNPPNVMWLETFKALGAKPVTLAWAEVYSGLAQGVIHAAEAPLGSILGAKLYEHKKVISTTGHFKAFVGMAIGTTYWNTLPKDVQQLLLDEGQKWGETLTQLTLSSMDKQQEQLEKEGVTFVKDVDVKSFQEATESVYSAFPKWTPGLHDKIKGILAN
jgi:TRAP-type C4-dicarboxylate transport system substrate-binding protein